LAHGTADQDRALKQSAHGSFAHEAEFAFAMVAVHRRGGRARRASCSTEAKRPPDSAPSMRNHAFMLSKNETAPSFGMGRWKPQFGLGGPRTRGMASLVLLFPCFLT
jgi:hypothetical protein